MAGDIFDVEHGAAHVTLLMYDSMLQKATCLPTAHTIITVELLLVAY